MATRLLWPVGLAAAVMAGCGSPDAASRASKPSDPAPVVSATARPTVAPPATTRAADPAVNASAAGKPSAAGSDDVEGANLRMNDMKVDGLQLSNIQCRTEGGAAGGLLGGLAVGAGFKARKDQLDACAPRGAVETRVRWTTASGHMTNVKASGPDAKVNQCVEQALNGAPSTLDGTCALTVRHGKP